MIHRGSELGLPATLEADLCVVGSGPGGSMVAREAARAGLHVVVLEAGELVLPSDMSQREEQMLPRLLWEAGARTTSDRAVHILQGRGVGGSSLHNLNLCKRIPPPVLERWRREGQLSHLPIGRWEALYAQVEAALGVSPVPQARASRVNGLLREGADRLGWAHGPLRHNRNRLCVGSGHCELGCAFDAKNHALRVGIAAAVCSGALVLTSCRAIRVEHDGGRVRGVRARVVEPITTEVRGDVEIRAPRVCLSASATGTAAILLRSEVPAPAGSTGESLRLHPGVAVIGDFEEPVHSWRGIPQSWECTELLDFECSERGRGTGPGGGRIWLIPATAHPMGTAVMLPGVGALHADWMGRFAHLAAFSAMLHDRSAGRVRPRGELGLRIDYRLTAADRGALLEGVLACARLLFAAGARRVVLGGGRPVGISSAREVDRLRGLEIGPPGIDLTAVHPMGSVPMDDDPARAAVDSRGRHHYLRGLWVADGSLFPSSIGVPPQLSIYAMGLHVGRAIVAELS